MRPGASTWEVVSAVATAGAVIVALGIAIAPVVHRWWARPVLKVTFGAKGPFVRARDPASSQRTIYFRACVSNNGRSDAKRVRAYVVAWYVLEPAEGRPPWLKYDIDPSALRWVSFPPQKPTGSSGRSTEITLGSHLYDFVDLFMLRPASTDMELLLDDPRERSFSTKPNRSDAQFRLKIVVTAENSVSVTKVVEFKANAAKWFHDVHEEEEPTDSYDLAFVNLIHGLAGENKT